MGIGGIPHGLQLSRWRYFRNDEAALRPWQAFDLSTSGGTRAGSVGVGIDLNPRPPLPVDGVHREFCDRTLLGERLEVSEAVRPS